MLRTKAESFSPISGWYNGKEATWYDFKESKPDLGNLYVLVTGFDANQNPQVVKNQNDVFDRKKEEMQSNSFWRIQYVTVPSDYQANSVKSVADIASHNWPTKDSGRVVNRPMVLKDDTISPDRPKVTGWADGEEVYSWQFEDTLTRDTNDTNKVATSTIYTLISSYDSNGTPIRVPDQKDILENIPGESGYSPLRRVAFVLVPADYQANSIKSKSDLISKGYSINESSLYLDLPIFQVEGQQVGTVTVPANTSSEPKLNQPTSNSSGKSSSKSKVSVSTKGQSSSRISINQQISGNQETKIEQMVTVTVSIEGFAFQPSMIDIPVDSTVVWVNNDSVPHTVTSDDGKFDSGTLQPGQSFSMIFTTLGNRTYHCSIHPTMQGTVNVH